MAGLYIHIPFCKKKCIYCDFYSVGSTDRIANYISSLIKELPIRIHEIGDDPIRTIYIGGGTPSLLSIEELSELILSFSPYVDFDNVEEFTIEVNPDDVSQDYIMGLIKLGINRVSVGIQSFNDQELNIINRRHNSACAIEAVKTIQRAGIDNISIDLIYGLPEQTIETWEDNIDEALKLNVNHISAYSLTYEEGTRLYQMRANGSIKECNEDNYIIMYHRLVNRLAENGFEHYEISNYAKREKYSQHNKAYWNNTRYIGLGVSAHSYDGRVRRYNPNNISKYIESINEGNSYCEVEEIDLDSKYNDCVMTQLRTMWGLNLSYIQDTFGIKYYDHCITQIKPFVNNRAIIQQGDNIRLSEDGIIISDNIFRELFMVED